MPDIVFQFIEELKRINWKCSQPELNDDGITIVRYSIKGKLTSYTVAIIFDTRGHAAVLRVFSLLQTPDDKRYELLELINVINYNYRWVRMFLDKDRDLNIQVDAIVDGGGGERIVTELLMCMARLVDEVYPRFMRLIWAD